MIKEDLANFDIPAIREFQRKSKRPDLSHIPETYDQCEEGVREMVDTVLLNLRRRYGYSQQSALDTVVFALRKNIVDLSSLLS